MGDAGLWVIALAALAAILTSMIEAYRAATRMLATMAENHILSEKFLKTNHSIMIVMVIAILISILGKNFMRYFLDLASLGAAIGFGYISLSAWKLARKNGSGVSAAAGALGTIASAAFAAGNLIPKFLSIEMADTKSLHLLLLWCLLGFLFYLCTAARKDWAPHSNT